MEADVCSTLSLSTVRLHCHVTQTVTLQLYTAVWTQQQSVCRVQFNRSNCLERLQQNSSCWRPDCTAVHAAPSRCWQYVGSRDDGWLRCLVQVGQLACSAEVLRVLAAPTGVAACGCGGAWSAVLLRGAQVRWWPEAEVLCAGSWTACSKKWSDSTEQGLELCVSAYRVANCMRVSIRSCQLYARQRTKLPTVCVSAYEVANYACQRTKLPTASLSAYRVANCKRLSLQSCQL
jgi:hypothetical protein